MLTGSKSLLILSDSILVLSLQVPDYLELVATPMDLGTIKEKLNTLQYPDVDSFVSDVRLVFTNSDKYNLVC